MVITLLIVTIALISCMCVCVRLFKLIFFVKLGLFDGSSDWPILFDGRPLAVKN
jgi:hypothetical protein